MTAFARLGVTADHINRYPAMRQEVLNVYPNAKFHDKALRSSEDELIAALLLLASEDAVAEHGLQPLGRLVDCHWAGLDPAQMGLALAGGPANKGISRLGLPSRRPKQGAGQITALTIFDQIAEVFPHRAAVGQVVIPRQISVEPRRLRLPGTEHLPLQRPQLAQGLLHVGRQGWQSGQPGRKTRT